MYVQEIIQTRVLDRVYFVEQCKESSRTDWRVRVVADAGSYRASEVHNTIMFDLGGFDREQAVRVFNAIVETAVDAVATPFDA